MLAPLSEPPEGVGIIRTLRSLSSRFGRDPCSVSRVASFCKFLPGGMDKTIPGFPHPLSPGFPHHLSSREALLFLRTQDLDANRVFLLRGLPRVYVQFLNSGREISARASHGSPKLCGYPVQRRVADITTHVWVRCAPYVMRTARVLCVACHAPAVHALSPGFSPARSVHLEHDTFSQAGK